MVMANTCVGLLYAKQCSTHSLNIVHLSLKSSLLYSLKKKKPQLECETFPVGKKIWVVVQINAVCTRLNSM